MLRKIKFSTLAVGIVTAIASVHFLCISTVFTVLLVRQQSRNLRVLLGMMAGLYLVWIIAGGLLQRWAGSGVSQWAARSSAHWRVRFFGLCVLMGMMEEAVATALTNSAPFLGVPTGEVYITASGNYWDVVLGHSLVVITPAFLAWVWLLNRYCFNAAEVFLLFGLTGTLMEIVYGGPAQALQVGMWVFVYGLMVYLPACTVPANRPARPPRPFHYLVAVLVPFLLMPLCFPLVLGIRAVRPSSATDFPPIVLSR